MEKNIIIGGAGYIGTVLIDYLLKKNKQVIVRYSKMNNEIITEEFDDVLFVPNISGKT